MREGAGSDLSILFSTRLCASSFRPQSDRFDCRTIIRERLDDSIIERFGVDVVSEMKAALSAVTFLSLLLFFFGSAASSFSGVNKATSSLMQGLLAVAGFFGLKARLRIDISQLRGRVLARIAEVFEVPVERLTEVSLASGGNPADGESVPLDGASRGVKPPIDDVAKVRVTRVIARPASATSEMLLQRQTSVEEPPDGDSWRKMIHTATDLGEESMNIELKSK